MFYCSIFWRKPSTAYLLWPLYSLGLFSSSPLSCFYGAESLWFLSDFSTPFLWFSSRESCFSGIDDHSLEFYPTLFSFFSPVALSCSRIALIFSWFLSILLIYSLNMPDSPLILMIYSDKFLLIFHCSLLSCQSSFIKTLQTSFGSFNLCNLILRILSF